MWGRYLPKLKAQQADVVIGAHPKLARLFERINFETFVVAEGRRLPNFDYWIDFRLLPMRLGWPPPAEAVYINLPREKSGGGIGVMPCGNPAYHNDMHRSLFGADANRLLGLGIDLRPESTGIYDFSDTADLINTLDLIVTVDTAVANLAGSMGKDCWVVIPRTGASYRWGRPGNPTWYPAVRQYRQLVSGDWNQVLDQITSDLELRSQSRLPR